MILRLLAITGIFVIVSCSADSLDMPASFSHLSLDFYEEFTPEGRKLVLHLETIDQYPCSNFLIKTTVDDSNQLLTINAVSLDIPDTCVSVFGPATQTKQLGNSDQFTKHIELIVNDKKHEFHFSISAEKIEAVKHPLFDNYLILSREELARIPEAYIWGYIEKNSEYRDENFEELMNDFKGLGAKETKLENGDYYYFKVSEGKIVYQDIGDENIELISIGFTFSRGFYLLVDHLIASGSGLNIRLFDTHGNSFKN